MGKPETQTQHEFLYWEFHEGGFRQAALYKGRWKGIRTGSEDAAVQLFDTDSDVAEVNDVAKQHPEIAATISSYLQSARTDIRSNRHPRMGTQMEIRIPSVSTIVRLSHIGGLLVCAEGRESFLDGKASVFHQATPKKKRFCAK